MTEKSPVVSFYCGAIRVKYCTWERYWTALLTNTAMSEARREKLTRGMIRWTVQSCSTPIVFSKHQGEAVRFVVRFQQAARFLPGICSGTLENSFCPFCKVLFRLICISLRHVWFEQGKDGLICCWRFMQLCALASLDHIRRVARNLSCARRRPAQKMLCWYLKYN